MKYPNFDEEKELRKRGYKIVLGLDESGRGSLAGPVVAAAVWIKDFSVFSYFPQNLNIKDSKKLTAKNREKIYNILVKNSAIEWETGKISEKKIDKVNMLEATKLAMEKARNKLEKNLKKNEPNKKKQEGSRQKLRDRRIFVKPSFLIIDGNFSINSSIRQKSIIKADEKVFSCVIAGIVAKVERDKMMLKYDKKYPEYGFARHKGYGTKLHFKTLKKYGSSKIHRKTFKPLSLEKSNELAKF